MDVRIDRTKLRLQLYQNGFTPLPNKRKMCLIKGWSTIEVTPDLIRSKEWARSMSFLDTGIRCGEVVALDWDIDDKDLLNDLLDAVVEQGLVEESPFVRIGMPPRELWVYRTSEKIGKRTTGHFAPQGAPDDFKGCAVEILGAGCQFAAFGQRDENTAYHWPEQSLVDYQYMDLPEITHAQVDVLKDFCAAFFEQRGLVRLSPGGGTDTGYTRAYDLTPDLIFEVHDLGEMTVEELQEYLVANPNEVLRCKVDALRPTSGSWAGMISLVQGSVCISDHGTYTSHFLAELDLEVSVSKLGALLEQKLGTSEPRAAADFQPIDFSQLDDMNPRAMFDENLAIALKRFAYIGNENLIYDLLGGGDGMNPQHFTIMMKPYYQEEVGKRGGSVVTRLSDMWLQHPDRLLARDLSMRPDQPWPIFHEDGELHINSYRPPSLPSYGGDASLGFTFIEQLLPDEDERMFFLRWLAYKLRHPDVRGPAIVMVAHDTYGTGRGTLVEIIRGLFGARLVNTVDFATLSGKTYQSQYNDWLADSLIVAVNEAQEATPNLSRWAARSNAYEHLKDIVDPSNHHVHIVRKSIGNYQGLTYSSILVMTNHADSLVIPSNDRRFAILTNGYPPTPAFFSAIHAWRAVPANLGAFTRELLALDMGAYNPYEPPPMTSGKEEMVEAGESEIDRALAAVLRDIGAGLVVKEQIILRIENWIADNNVEAPDDWHRAMERMFARKTRRVPGFNRIRVDGKQRVVRMVGVIDAKDLKSHESVVEAVQRNGPLTRPIKSSGGVLVAFPSR